MTSGRHLLRPQNPSGYRLTCALLTIFFPLKLALPRGPIDDAPFRHVGTLAPTTEFPATQTLLDEEEKASEEELYEMFPTLFDVTGALTETSLSAESLGSSSASKEVLVIKPKRTEDRDKSIALDKSLEELMNGPNVTFSETAKEKRKQFMRETLSQPQYAKMRERLRTLRQQFGGNGFRRFQQPAPTVAKNVEELERVDRSRDKNVVRNSPTIRHVNGDIGDLLIGGDMLLNNEHFAADHHNSQLAELSGSHQRRKRQLQAGWRRKWLPGVPISYIFDASIDENTRRLIRISAEFWTQHTCIDFQEGGSTQPRVRFFKGVGCYSEVGKARIFGTQDVSIGLGCELFGTITHEMGHVLGLFHHHSRTDRDEHITLMLANIDALWRAQYAKEYLSENYGVGYDYGSIMHYSGYQPQSETIEMAANQKQYQHTMGNNYGPMFSDLLAVNKYYNCPGRCSTGTDCKNFGFRNSRQCDKCICPNGFGGADCGERAAGEGDAPADCGQTVDATFEWQSLNGSVETGAYPEGRHSSDRSAGCHYHIKAPSGNKIELELEQLDGTCSPDCYFGALDMKVDDITKGGIRVCCESHREDVGKMTSTSNLVVLSLYTQRDKRIFKIRYRIYQEETSTAPASDMSTQLSSSAAQSDDPSSDSSTPTTSTTTTTEAATTAANCIDLAGRRCIGRFITVACRFRPLTRQLCRRTCGLC